MVQSLRNFAAYNRYKMANNSINIGWNKYETAILIDAYLQVKEGKLLRKDAISQISKTIKR
jgi:hypothetical protein